MTQTDSYGGYACNLRQNGYVDCTDGAHPMTTSFGQNVQVSVGNGIACAFQDGQGVPTHCSSYLATGCTNPSLDATVICWVPTDTTPVYLKASGMTPGFATIYYLNGPLTVTRNALGQLCVLVEHYHANVAAPALGTYAANDLVCGTQTNSQGDLF